MSLQRFPIVYLTGAPATGKSTVCEALGKRFAELLVFAYSKELRKFAEQRTGRVMSEDDIRRLSAAAITPEDVEGLDAELVELAGQRRQMGPMIIDSHAVTKESYGFRDPDFIVCLYTDPAVACERIRADARGRPQISPFEASMHTQLQCSVAIEYSILLGKPVYFIDSSGSIDSVVDAVATKARLA